MSRNENRILGLSLLLTRRQQILSSWWILYPSILLGKFTQGVNVGRGLICTSSFLNPQVRILSSSFRNYGKCSNRMWVFVNFNKIGEENRYLLSCQSERNMFYFVYVFLACPLYLGFQFLISYRRRHPMTLTHIQFLPRSQLVKWWLHHERECSLSLRSRLSFISADL
jgi:hypothetical protein